jgi:hypothetical protein
MLRLGAIIAGLVLALFLAAPASANTIATFQLDGTFSDGGTLTGSFTIDFTTQDVLSSSVFSSATSLPFVGGDYNGSPFDFVSALPAGSVTLGDGILFGLLGWNSLSLDFGPIDTTTLLSLPTVAVSGSETVYSLLCAFSGFSCGSRTFTGTLQVVAATPIPAALPLLATALGGIGFMGWRRKRQEAAAA